jgi:hypothetical protein
MVDCNSIMTKGCYNIKKMGQGVSIKRIHRKHSIHILQNNRYFWSYFQTKMNYNKNKN